MDINAILTAAGTLAGMGVIFAIILGVASKIFEVETDERVPLIMDALPGANCGGCGFAGCAAFAQNVVDGVAPVSGCPVGGASVAAAVATIMGVAADTSERKVAYVHCSGTCDDATSKYDYTGLQDCKSVMALGGGPKACNYACSGLGSCVKACKFDAIEVVNGVAVVNPVKCTACGACLKECPKGIIGLRPESGTVNVSCSSKDKGGIVRNICKVGCIGCGICAKNCPSEAITMDGPLAIIDHDKCTKCGVCVEKCPRKIIKTM